MTSSNHGRPRPLLCRFAWLLVALASGCVTQHELSLPQSFHDVPGRGAVAAELRAARAQLEQGDPAAALQSVETILIRQPKLVNGHRLRQDILRQRGRLGLVLREAEDRLDREPSAAWAHYLAGRVRVLDKNKQRAFRTAIELDPEFFWGWFGLAFTLRAESTKAAIAIYEYLYEQVDQEIRTAVSYAAALWQTGQMKTAVQVYEHMQEQDRGLSALGIAETTLRMGNRALAWQHVLEAMQFRPFDAGVGAVIETLVSTGSRDDRIEQVLDVLRRDPVQMRQFERHHSSLLARLFLRIGDPVAAVSIWRRQQPRSAADRFAYRTLLISVGDVRGFLRQLRASRLPVLIEDQGNQVANRWRGLHHGAWMTAADPLREPAMAVALTDALIAVGYLEFADRIATRALLRHVTGDQSEQGDRGDRGDAAAATSALASLQRLQVEVRRELAFEAGIQRILRQSYLDHKSQTRSTKSLAQILDELRELSLRVLGHDVIEQPKLFSLPFVGVLIDSLGPGLPAHLARFNRHLVMGQRSGGPVEAMILTRLSVRHVDPVEGLPLPPRCIEVVGEHRLLDPPEQGDLAGIALLNHYVIDMDEVRAWAATIAQRRRVARADDKVVLRDPLPRRVDPLDPAGVEWRLSLVSPVRDSDLETAVLDVIRWHERGHMVDFLHFLPISRSPLRALALVLRNGFDSLMITAEMEGRAQLTALAMSPHTHIVLAHVAGFLSGSHGNSPHALGFRAMAATIHARLEELGVPDRDASRWHKLAPEVVRETARQALRRLW